MQNRLNENIESFADVSNNSPVGIDLKSNRSQNCHKHSESDIRYNTRFLKYQGKEDMLQAK